MDNVCNHPIDWVCGHCDYGFGLKGAVTPEVMHAHVGLLYNVGDNTRGGPPNPQRMEREHTMGLNYPNEQFMDTGGDFDTFHPFVGLDQAGPFPAAANQAYNQPEAAPTFNYDPYMNEVPPFEEMIRQALLEEAARNNPPPMPPHDGTPAPPPIPQPDHPETEHPQTPAPAAPPAPAPTPNHHNDDEHDDHEHEQAHGHRNGLICPHCGPTNRTTPASLQRHISQAHPTHPKIYYHCDDCDYVTDKAEDLPRHRNSKHQRVQEFQCPLCPKKFSRRDNARRHVRIKEKRPELMDAVIEILY